MKNKKKTHIYNNDCYSSKVKNTFSSCNDEGLIKLQYAINKQAVLDLKEKNNMDSVKSLCNYLISHIIEDEITMKEVIYKALEMRQLNSLKQLEKTIKESEDIIKDMKISLEQMYDLMCEDDTKHEEIKAPVASEKAEEIEKKLIEESTKKIATEKTEKTEKTEDESEEIKNEDY